MKFSCEKSLLLTAVNTASRAASPKSDITALEGLLIEADAGITISGYDLKTGIRTSFPADVTEPGKLVLDARLFGDIIRKLPDDVVTVESKDGVMTKIACAMSEFNILGTPAANYPELPTVDHQHSLRIKEGLLKAMISQTNFAVSTNEARPIHTGELFETDGETLTMVAVDGYRLALRREKLETAAEPCSFVVPGTALAEIERIAGDGEDAVVITLGTKHVLFEIGTTLVISRRLEGEFLNYKSSIPHDGKFVVKASRRAVIEAVERVSLIISDKQKSPVRCTFGENALSMCTSTPLGKAYDECEVVGDGGGLEIGFNNKYVLDALKAAPAEEVFMQLSTGVAPCVVIPADGSRNFLYMILPVRLRANEG